MAKKNKKTNRREFKRRSISLKNEENKIMGCDNIDV